MKGLKVPIYSHRGEQLCPRPSLGPRGPPGPLLGEPDWGRRVKHKLGALGAFID